MSRPLSPAQRAVADFIATKFAETKLPVTRYEIAVGLNSPRGLTSTLASLIERDAIMPLHRVGAAESFVPASERIPQLAKLLKLDPVEKDVEKRIRARLAGIGVKDVCGRCGGSGHYSFNQIDGTRCFGCNGQQYVAVPLTPWRRSSRCAPRSRPCPRRSARRPTGRSAGGRSSRGSSTAT